MKRYDSYKDSGVKWLGEIPSHWEMLALKHILKLKKEIVGKRADQFDLLSLTLRGIIKRDIENPEGKFPESFDSYQVVKPNDFIFCNFDNEETPRAVGLSSYKGMITGAYDVLYRKSNKLTDKFLIYYFLYIDDAKRFKPLYKGLRKTIPFDSFMSYKIPVPSLKEQDRIVAYLDATTSKIDEAIAQQQKMIDLLNERKQIIINNAVTKGLNPNAPMKDSGIERIGLIPNHWLTKRLEYCIDILPGYAFSSQDFVERGIKLLRGVNVAPETIRWDDIVYWDKDLDESLEKYLLKENDLVLGLDRPWIGSGTRVTLVKKEDLPCLLVQRVCRIRVANDMSIKYLYYLLSNKLFYDALGVDTTGVSVPHLSTEQIKKVIMPIPMLSEQNSIVEYIEKQIASVNNAILAANEQISLLQERKQIIINDVVTGKVKVI